MTVATQEGEDAGQGRGAKLLAILIRLAAVGVPMLYVIGRTYSDGYWTSLGLPTGLLAYDVDDYLYLGFVAIVVGSTRLIGITGDATSLYVLVGGITLSIITIQITLIDHWLTTKLRPRLKSIDELTAQWREKHRGKIQTFLGPAAAVGFGYYVLFFVVFISLLVALVCLLLVYKAGEITARADMDRYAKYQIELKDQRPATASYRAGIDGSMRQGMVSECSPEWCLIYTHGKIIAIPAADVMRIAGKRMGGASSPIPRK